MEVAKIQVGGTCACAYEKKTIRAGMVGVTVSFAFDEYWDGLNKIAVYRCGGVVRDEYLEGDTGTIPADVLTKSGFDLEVGVYGTDAEKQIAIPTCWANLGVVRPGADPSGDPAADPSLPIWAQILAKLGNLADLSTEAKENLVAAINEALTKGGGEVDPEEIGRIVDEYLEKNPPAAYTLPIATETTLGGVKAAAATEEMTQPVGITAEGKLVTVPCQNSGGSAADAVSQHNVATDSHADLRLELQNLADRVNAVLDSDDITLDELSEIVAYIKSNKTLIDAITTSKVSVTDIIDNLVTNVANKPLSAAQGVVLKGMIEEIRGLIPPAYTLPVGGNELGGVKNGGNVTINEDGTMTAPEVSGGSGIAVTGATVGQTVKIAAVDEEGVPTAWEPVDMPSGGGEEWDELANVTLEEESMPFIDIGDYAANFKKLRFFIVLESMTPASTRFALGNSTSMMGNLGYNICEILNFGNESGISKAIIEFEPLIEEGFCRASSSWITMPATSPKASNFSYQYNSYDYGRLKKARYLYPSIQLPAGTMIAIKGVRA